MEQPNKSYNEGRQSRNAYGQVVCSDMEISPAEFNSSIGIFQTLISSG